MKLRFEERLRRDGPPALMLALALHFIVFTLSVFVVPQATVVELETYRSIVPTLAIDHAQSDRAEEPEASSPAAEQAEPEAAAPSNVAVEQASRPIVPVTPTPTLEALSSPAQPPKEDTLNDITFGATSGAASSASSGQGTGLGLASHRQGEGKAEALRRFGGSPATESALDAGLHWLKSVQRLHDPASRHYGSWDSDGFASAYLVRAEGENDIVWQRRLEDEGSGSTYYDLGLTALCLLAFTGAGHTPSSPEFGTSIRAAMQYILAQQTDDGSFISPVRLRSGNMYDHALSVLSLSDLARLSNDDTLKPAIRKGQQFLIRTQQSGGGWDYKAYKPAEESDRSDLSITGFCAMALSSCESLGIVTPQATLTRLRDFLRSMTTADGTATYADAGIGATRFTLGVTAVNLFTRRLFGEAVDSEVQQKMVRRLASSPPTNAARSIDNDPYAWYYASLAMVAGGDEAWGTYNNALKRTLLEAQVTQAGPRKGSWNPNWYYAEHHGGRVYATAMACLCLEAYYRYLPEYVLTQSANHADLWRGD